MLIDPMKIWIKSAAIDFGTVNTLIAIRGKGIVLREPTAVAVDAADKRTVLAVGAEALSLAGRSPGGVNVIYPMRDGVIADYDIAGTMLRAFVKKALGKRGGLGCRLMMCLPLCVTEVERRALTDAAKAAGARDVMLMEEPVAAAIGARLPIFEPIGAMVVDIGGGTTDAVVLAMGGIAAHCSIRTGGRQMDGVIREYVARQYGIAIGERTAENVKLTLASALPGGMERMQIRGRSIKTGLPASTVINGGEISHAVAPVVRILVDVVKKTLSETPPELAADLMDQGVTLTGGGALLPGLARLMAHETGLGVRVAEDPLDCVVLGALDMLETPESFENAEYA